MEQYLVDAVLVAMFFAFMGIIMASADLVDMEKKDKNGKNNKVINYNKRK